MSAKTRRRTAGQRGKAAEPVVIQNEEEQDQEIKALKTKNDADNKRAWRTLDFGTLLIICMRFVELYKQLRASSFVLAMITFGQIAMMATAFSPRTIPYYARVYQDGPERAYRFHYMRVMSHAMITACGLAKLLGEGQLGLSDATRLVLPPVLHAGVLMQVSGEQETAERFRLLEAARYTMKGA